MSDLLRFFSSWQNMLSLMLVTAIAALSLAAPWISPMNPKDPGIFQRVGRALDYEPQPPSEKAFLGTLPGQYDVFHALVWGTGEALRFGLTVAAFSALLGVLLGAVAGYAGGIVNSVIMRVTDAFLAFPVIAGVVFLQQLVNITITALGGMVYLHSSYGKIVEIPTTMVGIQAFLQRTNPLLISLILFSWMPFTRLVNSLVITLKRNDFVQASRALGAGPVWIIHRHLLPHTVAPVLVLAARDVGAVVVLQATFTFIGIGGNSTWGSILSIGRNWVVGPGGNLFAYWWVFLPATLVVILFGVVWNMLADGISEISLPPSEIIAPDQLPEELKLVRAASPGFFVAGESFEARQIPIGLSVNHETAQADRLAKARLFLSRGKVQAAVEIYRFSILKDQMIDKVILELQQAVKQYPQEAVLWEILGEAYNQDGQLTPALEAYSQAIARYNRIKAP